MLIERLRQDPEAREKFRMLIKCGYNYEDFQNAPAAIHALEAQERNRSSEPFILNNDAPLPHSMDGAGEFDVVPARLVEVFGEPNEAEDKSTGEYRFTNSSGEVFSIMDYKATTAYDPEAMYRPSELWKAREPVFFILYGPGRDEGKKLIDWILEKTKEEKKDHGEDHKQD